MLREINHDLQYHRDMLHTILNSISDGFVLLDRQGQVQTINERILHIFGSPSAEIFAHKSWHAVCQDKRWQKPLPFLWVLDTLESGTYQEQHIGFTRADQTTSSLVIKVFPIFGNNKVRGEYVVERLVLHITDDTSRLLREKDTVYYASLSSGRDLMAVVAHEVNSPLQTIMFSIEMMNSASPERRQKFLSIALAEVKRISTYLDECKTFYHTSSPSSEVDINELVERVLHLMSAKLHFHRINSQVTCCSSLPYAQGQKGKLHQVLFNIVLNAIDAMPDGGSLFLRTRKEQQQGQDMLVIEVEDTGIGIDPALKDRIFGPYFTTKGKEGSGIGLFIASTIIREHKGKIEVASDPGKGTLFTIMLPKLTGDEHE
jgi:signal transduction histidine kinase